MFRRLFQYDLGVAPLPPRFRQASQMTDGGPLRSNSTGGSSPGSRGPQHWVWGIAALVVVVAVCNWTSSDRPFVEQTQPQYADDLPPKQERAAESSPPRPQPATNVNESSVSIESLADDQQGWIQIVSQAHPGKRSAAEAKYRGRNDFEVTTSNVDSFEIDLAKLSVDRTRRFIMHIDSQDMLLFPEEMGVIRFERSPEGTWIYVKE